MEQRLCVGIELAYSRYSRCKRYSRYRRYRRRFAIDQRAFASAMRYSRYVTVVTVVTVVNPEAVLTLPLIRTVTLALTPRLVIAPRARARVRGIGVPL